MHPSSQGLHANAPSLAATAENLFNQKENLERSHFLLKLINCTEGFKRVSAKYFQTNLGCRGFKRIWRGLNNRENKKHRSTQLVQKLRDLILFEKVLEIFTVAAFHRYLGFRATTNLHLSSDDDWVFSFGWTAPLRSQKAKVELRFSPNSASRQLQLMSGVIMLWPLQKTREGNWFLPSVKFFLRETRLLVITHLRFHCLC